MKALHVSNNKIILNFDEYIDMKEIRSNLIVSPVPKLTPTIYSHLRTVTITMRDSLRPNTTYALDFGKAITDVNEGNILKNFTYVFSTGNYLDSFSYSGRVIMAFTGRPDSTLIAMLHDSLYDSAVAKVRPRYIARLDSSGNFTFRNIRAGTYALFAMKDESGMHVYSTKAQTFAFADNLIDLHKSNAPLTLYAFEDTSGIKLPKKQILLPQTPPRKKDDKDKPKRLEITGNIPNGQLDLHDQFIINFTLPVRYMDSSKISLSQDSFLTLKPNRFLLDSTNKKLTIYYNWKENTKYNLVLQKDFAEDTLSQKLLKIDTIHFSTKKESDYGNLRLRFRNLDLSRHPVLFFVQSEQIMGSYPIGASLRYNNKLFNPGEYEIRILYDTNQNGVWDPGDYYKKRQPEIVFPIKRKLNVKANWDNEVDISL